MATPNFILPPGVTVPRSLVPISAPSSTLTDVESFLMSQCYLAHDVLPDGNCMFRALSHQLYGSDQHHVQVRSMLLEVIESNKIIYQPYWIEDMPSLVPRPHPDFISQPWRKIWRRPGGKTTSRPEMVDSVST